ncbi:N-acetylglucosamine-6-phosphate deacetylase [Sinomicrobium weinanense]|uniref:N-acetylglucosamine-6-phosphate deacetylase n=1 Tax=Sinomicrobium weinanense TaxID=2842200 RepID=A0A926Q4V5_9FLAO|nr:N-acetylglucosamine-6-phosphate deacetylase [Sinomicrobium weinanense]MBC9797486.1 N-acetylglucosamine-6-phosphate deacetylase [Sinomicrobium weinanense]MBU3124478.1 N-acetylglucosamine-6-phosphate deacetylase [Sinomicrobium weinanense]
MPIAYTNARIFTGDSMETDKVVLVRDGIIEDVISVAGIPEEYHREDLGGMYLAPAFIDLQIYGGEGKLFSQELSMASLEATYAYGLRGGCTHFMITLATNTVEKFLKSLEVAKRYVDEGGKGLLGVHLEGPYINPDKRGAHLAECVKVPEPEEIELLLQKGGDIFRMMTLAPEQCNDEVLDLLLERGILVSAGHSNATYAEAMHGFDRGIPAATHLFNAMSPLHHRAPGMVGAVFDHPSAMASIVCDGIHVDYAAVRAAKKIMGDRLFFITDAVTETPEGEYKHIFANDRYTLPDATLSGSALNMMQCVRNGVKHARIPLEEALRMASAYPAQLLKNNKLGKIASGYKADMVIFDDSLEVHQTIAS